MRLLPTEIKLPPWDAESPWNYWNGNTETDLSSERFCTPPTPEQEIYRSVVFTDMNEKFFLFKNELK